MAPRGWRRRSSSCPIRRSAMSRSRQEILPADDHADLEDRTDEIPDLRSSPCAMPCIAKQERERLRLLYVAMTRAEKWLIVGGGRRGRARAMQAGTNAWPTGWRACGDYDAKTWRSGTCAACRTVIGMRLALRTVTHQQTAACLTARISARMCPCRHRPRPFHPLNWRGDKVLPGDAA